MSRWTSWFGELLDRHGGRIERWPERDREAARAFAERDRAAASELARAECLELALDDWHAPGPSPDLRRRIASVPALEGVPEPEPQVPNGWVAWTLGRWREAGGILVALALGIATGVSPVGAALDEVIDPGTGLEMEIDLLVQGLLEEDNE